MYFTLMTAMMLSVSAAPVDHRPMAPITHNIAWAPVKLKWQPLTYSAGVQEAKKSDKPLVVFIGTTPRDIKGCHVAYEDKLVPFNTPSIVVSLFVDGKHIGVPINANATDTEILTEVQSLRPAKVVTPRFPLLNRFLSFGPGCVGST